MTPAGEKRIRQGVLVGSLAMFAAVLGAMVYEIGISRLSPRAYWGVIIVAVVIALPLGRLAVVVTRRLAVIRLLDTIVATIVVIAVLAALVLLNRLSDSGSRIRSGERCGDGTGRRIIQQQSPQEPGGPIYWTCVSQEDYDAWLARAPVAQRKPASTGPTAEEYFKHVVRIRLMLKSAIFGTIAALAGWLYSFGFRWKVRTDEL